VREGGKRERDALPKDVRLRPLEAVLEPELALVLLRRATGQDPRAVAPSEGRREPVLGEVVLAPRVVGEAALAALLGREGDPDHVVDAVQTHGVGDLVAGKVDRAAGEGEADQSSAEEREAERGSERDAPARAGEDAQVISESAGDAADERSEDRLRARVRKGQERARRTCRGLEE